MSKHRRRWHYKDRRWLRATWRGLEALPMVVPPALAREYAETYGLPWFLRTRRGRERRCVPDRR